jgi:peptide/nickel transport system ATP-binding protein
MTALLEVRNLEVKYHTHQGILTAIRDLSFDVQPGEIVGIVGESGCGKSTVATAVMRLLPPNGEITHGSIVLNGQDVCRLDEEALRRLRGQAMSMIFQDPMTCLNPVFSIEAQMLDALKAHPGAGTIQPGLPARADGLLPPQGSGRAARLERAVGMLDRVGIADARQRIKEFPHQFSGGMRQRMMIATALLSHPALLIADEPTSALDVTLEAQILDLIRGLRAELGTAILYITHDLGVVAQLCDRVMVMYAGGIVESGSMRDTFERPRHPYTQALLRSHPSRSREQARLTTIPGRVPSLKDLPPGCKFAPRCERQQPACQQVEPPPIWVDRQQVWCHAWATDRREGESANRRVSEAMQPPAAGTATGSLAGSDIVVATHGLCTHFDDRPGILGQLLRRRAGCVRAVDGIDLTIRRGETLGLVGESGSGKTTLGRTILRLQRPSGGRIEIEGREITGLGQAELRALRRRTAMIFQDPVSSLSPRMKVSALLLEPYRIHGLRVDDRQRVAQLLEMVGLSAEQADKYPHQLSGGQARRVGIARALALNPELLVADEPTAGLDVSVAAGILNLLKELRERLQLTYLIITHNLNDIRFIADRIAVMYLGRLVELASTQQIFEQARHPYTEALISAVPVPDPDWDERAGRIILEGEIPSPRRPPAGCHFHPRCRYAGPRCTCEAPGLQPVDETGHLAACHFPERVRAAPC